MNLICEHGQSRVGERNVSGPLGLLSLISQHMSNTCLSNRTGYARMRRGIYVPVWASIPIPGDAESPTPAVWGWGGVGVWDATSLRRPSAPLRAFYLTPHYRFSVWRIRFTMFFFLFPS